MSQETKERPILLVDGFNIFVRHYCANPAMTSTGIQAGGVIGFLKTLMWTVDLLFPSKVIVVWEAGGSTKKRALFPEYKAHRKPLKLNRFYEGDIPDSEDNKISQLVSLVKILRELPVCQLYMEGAEADDVLAYVAKYVYSDKEKLIMSSDHDFYQLLDAKTKMYLTHRKSYVTVQDALKETGIHPNNFCTARTFCGDKSDNIPGVKGAGLKTLAKRFPSLSGEKFVSVDDIISESQAQLDKGQKIFQHIYESAELAKRNWKLMFLDTSTLSASQISKTKHVVDTFEPRLNKISLLRTLLDEGIRSIDADQLYFTFNYVLC